MTDCRWFVLVGKVSLGALVLSACATSTIGAQESGGDETATGCNFGYPFELGSGYRVRDVGNVNGNRVCFVERTGQSGFKANIVSGRFETGCLDFKRCEREDVLGRHGLDSAASFKTRTVGGQQFTCLAVEEASDLREYCTHFERARTLKLSLKVPAKAYEEGLLGEVFLRIDVGPGRGY